MTFIEYEELNNEVQYSLLAARSEWEIRRILLVLQYVPYQLVTDSQTITPHSSPVALKHIFKYCVAVSINFHLIGRVTESNKLFKNDIVETNKKRG